MARTGVGGRVGSRSPGGRSFSPPKQSGPDAETLRLQQQVREAEAQTAKIKQQIETMQREEGMRIGASLRARRRGQNRYLLSGLESESTLG